MVPSHWGLNRKTKVIFFLGDCLCVLQTQTIPGTDLFYCDHPVGKKKEAITWPSLNFSKHMTHLELRPSECTDSVLSVSLVLPFSSLVLNESEEPLWYFLVSILDKACSAILVREDCVSDRKKKTNTWWEERSGLFNKYGWTRQKYRSIERYGHCSLWLCDYQLFTQCSYLANQM